MNINWDSPVLIFSLVTVLFLQLYTICRMQAWYDMAKPVLKTLFAVLALAFAYYFWESRLGILAIFGLFGGALLGLIALGELILSIFYRLSGIQKKL